MNIPCLSLILLMFDLSSNFASGIETRLSATLETDSQTVDIGNEAILTCRISGHPVKSVMWLKNGQPLKIGGRINLISRDIIRIDSVQKEDEGTYQCFIANDLETAHGTIQLDTRESPPQFVGTFSESIVEQGSRVSLKCGATGNPLPQITWTLDNQPIREAYHIRIGDYVSDIYTVNSYVNISATKLEDGGVYACRAVNSAGDRVYRARINVIGPPYIRSMANITALSNQNIHIPCPYSGYPIKSITWIKDGRHLPQNHRQKVSTNGTLTIYSVEKNSDASRYECNIVGEDGRTTKRDLFINVVVSPVVEPFNFPSDLVAGRRAGAACIVSAGDLPIRISWLKDGQNISDYLNPVIDTKDFSSFLTIERVSKEHSGLYTCLAENPAASANHSASLLVQVPPSWIVEPKDASVIKGHSITLDCQADGSPLPIIRWKKSIDGGDFKVVISNAHIQTLENGSLTIREVMKEDAGQYMCQAINAVGPGTSTVVRLTVNVAAHFEKKFESHTVKKGENIALQCRAIGEKEIKMSWSKDHQPLHHKTDSRYFFEVTADDEGSKSILRINSLDRRDSSLFTCHAENNYGKDSTNFQVLIQEPPDCPTEVRAGEIGSRSLTISWNPPYTGNSVITNYTVEYRSRNFYSDTKEMVARDNVPGSATSHTIKGLHPLATYSITVIAQNSLGSSTSCSLLSLTTDGEPPSAPPRDIKVLPISSSSLQITWKAPAKSQQNGPIVGYYVGYRLYRSPSDELAYRNVESKSNDGHEETCVISDLRKLTRYIIIVQAYNKKGAGPSSEPVEAQTLEFDPPPPPPLRVLSTGHHYAYLTWDPNFDFAPSGSDGNGMELTGSLSSASLASTTGTSSASPFADPMTGYTLHHKPEKGEWQEVPIYFDKLSYNMSNLHCGKRYQFYMVAFNSAGRGQPSEVISIKTQGTAPIAPDSHELIGTNSTFALVNLSSWGSGGCPILNFNAQYKLKNQRDYIILSNNLLPEQKTFLITDLRPATWYNLFITAYNDAGSTGAEYTFATLTMDGETIPPPVSTNMEDIAQQLKFVMPMACALVVSVLILLIICTMVKKRQQFPSASFAASGDVSKACEAVPLNEWDACKRSSRCQGIDDSSAYFNSTSGLKSETPSNDQMYFPSPYALSRISVYERAMVTNGSDGHSHVHSHPPGTQHTYDVPIKKCLMNPGNQLSNPNKSSECRLDPDHKYSSQEKLYERLERRGEKYDWNSDFPSSSVLGQLEKRKKRRINGQDNSDTTIYA
ncbi:cell adhesion molecule Dscam1-like [Brevipalpus obovatus]|uniref:cell adhesion molecule Dscam1-like n=1 Tax=Brevipalpus obovatus TaxID=246614 RepID=UPI003D9EC67A